MYIHIVLQRDAPAPPEAISKKDHVYVNLYGLHS